MKKKNFLIYFLILFFVLSNNLKSNIQNSIIVKVDRKIVTTFEIKNKILSTLIISGNEISQKNIDELKTQTLDNLIFFKLKEIELEKYNYKINKGKLDEYIYRISGKKPQTLKNEFKNNSLDFNLWVKEVETELKWKQFIYSNYAKKIEIDDNFINEEVNKILKSNNKNVEFNLSEIEVLQDNINSNKDLISKIYGEINKNGFDNTALKLSVSNSSADKGNIGWINLNVLSKEISNILKELEPGEVSKPIIRANTILFLKLNSKKTLNDIQLDREKLKKNLIQVKQNELFNLFSTSHLSKLKNNYLIQYQ